MRTSHWLQEWQADESKDFLLSILHTFLRGMSGEEKETQTANQKAVHTDMTSPVDARKYRERFQLVSNANEVIRRMIQYHIKTNLSSTLDNEYCSVWVCGAVKCVIST
jgi:hypothetical protein